MFFDKPWSDVSDKEISQLASVLSESTGGHVFHTKFDVSSPTPHVTLEKAPPGIMNDY